MDRLFVIAILFAFLCAGCETFARVYQSTCACNQDAPNDAVYLYKIEKEF